MSKVLSSLDTLYPSIDYICVVTLTSQITNLINLNSYDVAYTDEWTL